MSSDTADTRAPARFDSQPLTGHPSPRLATILLGLSIFATGFCGLVSEFILSTVSSYILGNSVEQFSVIIALMMLMMGLAGALQRLFPDRHLVLQFIAVEVALALLGGFAPLAIYAGYGLLEHHFLVVLYFFVAAIGFLIGFELPLVLRMNAQYSQRLSSNLAVVLSLDYIGGFVGALVWTRYLLRELPLTESSFLIAGFNFSIAAVAFLYFAPAGRRALTLVPIVVVAVALLTGYHNNRDWNAKLEQRLYDDRIVFAETTRYQRIVITHDRQRDDYRIYLNGNLQSSSVDEAIYHEHLVVPAMEIAARRDRVLILGGGDGMALREVLKHPEVAHATLVDLDPRMTELATSNPILVALNGGALSDHRVEAIAPAGISAGESRPIFQETGLRGSYGQPEVEEVARVKVINVDAERFVASLPGLFDVVIIDFPDPGSVELSKLYSREFYIRLRRLLAPGAVVALQATSPYHAKEAFLCIQRTLASAGYSVVPYHDNIPSFGSWGFLIASASASGELDLRQRIQAIESFAIQTRYLTPDLMRSATVFGKGRLDSDEEGVNSLMHPLLLDLYLHASWLGE